MSLACADCDEPYGSRRFPDLLIPTHVWKQINNGSEGGVLCPNCIIGRLHDAGLDKVPCWFASGPLSSDANEPVWLWKERLLRAETDIEELRALVLPLGP